MDEGIADFGESEQSFRQGREFLVEEIEELGCVHGIEFVAEAIQALAKDAFAAEKAVIAGVVVAEAIATQGDGAAALAGRQDKSALKSGLADGHVMAARQWLRVATFLGRGSGSQATASRGLLSLIWL
ncbi:MAG: hypothetical protein WA634_06520 [Silvibacterium sp.]